MSKTTQLTPEQLARFRARYHLTAKDAANYVGVHPLTWSRWEQGKNRIPSYLFLALKPIADKLRELEQLTKGDDK